MNGNRLSTNHMKILITGGAGFIGSNIVEACLADERITLVRVLDDLSNGYIENVQLFEGHPKYEFIRGCITNYDTCVQAMQGIDRVCHQAALGSVPRSIENPMRTNEVNIGGSVTVMKAAQAMGIDRVVHAFSSSTYGDSKELPKVEERIGKPLSPYAVSKFACESYADVFYKTYGLNFVGLRYFNIFGPRQSPTNPYAAAIPLFCQAFIEDRQPVVNGDGSHSRDFTFVQNAVQANMLALFTEDAAALNQVYNVACGDQITLKEMIEMLQEISGKDIQPIYGPERIGDVKHSKADITKIQTLLHYKPQVSFKEGLKQVYAWYVKQSQVSA